MNAAAELKTSELDSGEASTEPRFRHFEAAATNVPSARTAQWFFVSAIVAVLAFSPHFLYQDRTWNFLIYIAAALALGGLTVTRRARRGASASFSRRIHAALSTEQWTAFAIFVAFLAFYGVTMFDPSPYNEQVRQAVAFVQGHIHIEAPDTFLEHAQVGPYSYSLHPPLAPILLIPFTAIWRMDTNQTEFSVVIGAIDIALAWILLGRFKLSNRSRVWLTIFFGTGNILWYETVIGSTWALPMVVAVLFLLALLIELFGAARPLWLGIWGGLACLARYDAALAMPVIALLAWRRRTISELLWIIPGFLAVGAIFVGLNEARYHSLFDNGLNYIPNTHHTGPNDSPWFGLQYLTGNLNTLLFMAPRIDNTFPYLHPVFSGQALTLTSPAFVLALRASFKRLEVVGMGMAAALISIPSLLCYANGFAQFGTRHYIPAFPFLLVMMAIGMPRRTDQLTKILICVSIFLVGFGVWHIHVWGLSGP